MDFSQALRLTKAKITQALNESGLPIDAMDMMLGEIKLIVHTQAEAEYAAMMQQAQAAEQQAAEQEAQQADQEQTEGTE